MDTGHEAVESEIAKVFNEDIIKKMNIRLLAGEAPDVLLLDGLSIDSLYQKEFLSEFELGLDESQYYGIILNSYATENGIYAYPTFFGFTALLSY